MRTIRSAAVAALFAFVCFSAVAKDGDKTYKHASQYQVATLDQNSRVFTESDMTGAKHETDAKMSGGGQNSHLLYTNDGTYRVEAPINRGRSLLAGLVTPAYARLPTIHNKWFLDSVQPGTKVLVAAACGRPNQKRLSQPVDQRQK